MQSPDDYRLLTTIRNKNDVGQKQWGKQMTGRLEGKVAVITGGASGIGAGTVRRFIDEGARCVVSDIQEDAGKAFTAQFGDKAIFIRADVAVESDVAATVQAAVSHFGRIDCMFNNAGILGAVGPISDISGDDWSRSIGVLLSSVFYGIKHASQAMITAGTGGVILNTTSTAGLRAGLGPHVYTAAKHGVLGLTKCAAQEFAAKGVRVNAILPGTTRTPMIEGFINGDPNIEKMVSRGIGRGYLGEPAEIAEAAVWLCSDRASFVSGASLSVDGSTVNR